MRRPMLAARGRTAAVVALSRTWSPTCCGACAGATSGGPVACWRWSRWWWPGRGCRRPRPRCRAARRGRWSPPGSLRLRGSRGGGSWAGPVNGGRVREAARSARGPEAVPGRMGRLGAVLVGEGPRGVVGAARPGGVAGVTGPRGGAPVAAVVRRAVVGEAGSVVVAAGPAEEAARVVVAAGPAEEATRVVMAVRVVMAGRVVM